MQTDIKGKYEGFTLLEEKQINEIRSIARVFYHEKSGARLLQLENDDDNKVFSISFRTPPADSTGVPHILEHSVLCGSRKYPSKEPFVELVKGSMNTFLNAMTFGDKTMYPIASRNEKDFYNLMDVYLDAVFYPKIYEYPEILMQEGWHHELEDKNEDITIKGVVYNEMKGAFSSPESILGRKIQETLFPDTPYGNESGGDPDDIPQLTQAAFTDFHKKYYHPSNSYIFIYGNEAIEKVLKFINDGYLKEFERKAVNSQIPEQKPFKAMQEMTIPYPISDDEEETGKCYFSLNFVTGKSVDAELYLAMEVLEHILMATPASPLKKALVEAQLGKDVFGQFDNSILQPVFSIVVKHAALNEKERFKNIVFNTLKDLVTKGIDKKLIEASINRMEFQLREADYRSYPKGLIYNIKSMDSWLYDMNPLLHLEYEPILDKIKTALNTDYFEKMINQYLLKNTHCSLLILEPEKGLAEKRLEALRSQLAQYKSRLTDQEVQEIINQTKHLKKRQTTPDSPEAIQSIPLLALTDLEKNAELLEKEVSVEQNISVIRHHAFTNRIAYIQFLFDTKAVPQALIPYVGLLADIMGKVSTEHYDYAELSKETNIHTGDIRSVVQVYGDKSDANRYFPKLTLKTKVLVDKMPRLFELLEEIVMHQKLDNKTRLKEIIQEQKSRLEMRISGEGHIIAIKRLFSYFTEEGQYTEQLTGLTYYKFIADLEKQFDAKIEAVIENLKQTASIIFNKHNLLISVTCEAKDYARFQECLPILLNSLHEDKQQAAVYRFDSGRQNEGLMTQGKVQYVAKGFNFQKLGYAYTGSLQVLKTIVRYDYLWNQIRVQGGAYGAFSGFEYNGNMFFASYRDPNLRETFDVYDRMYQYLSDFNIDDRELTKYIIGTVSRLDMPLTPPMKGELITEYYIRGINHDDVQQERNEIIETKQKDIAALSDLIRECMLQNYYCVLGSEIKIKQNKELFNQLITVFE